MPRFLAFLALALPLVAVLWAYRSVIPALSFPLTWPLAVHPDQLAKQHAYGDAAAHQQPFQAVDVIDHSAQHHAHHAASPAESSEPHEGAFTRRIVAVGDLHGDMPNAQRVLHMAGVVDEQGNWSGQVDFFVQTGDIINRSVAVRAYTYECLNSRACVQRR